MARVLKQWTVVHNPDRRDVFGGPRQSVNYQHFLLIYQRISDHTAVPLVRSEDIFAALSQFMHAAGSEATKMVSIAAVGAPVTERSCRKIQPRLVAYHCIIHQSAVLRSQLCEELVEVI